MVLQFARKGNTWSLPYPEKGKCGNQYRHESWKYHHVKDFFYALIWLKILITFRKRWDYLVDISGFRGRITFTLCWSPSCGPSCFQGLCLEGCKNFCEFALIKGNRIVNYDFERNSYFHTPMIVIIVIAGMNIIITIIILTIVIIICIFC